MSNCFPNYQAVLGCPNCYKVYSIKDLDCFLERKHMLWRRVLARLEDSFTKQLEAWQFRMLKRMLLEK